MPPERRLQFVQLQQRVGNEVRGLEVTVTCGVVRGVEREERGGRVFTWTFPQRQWPVVWVDMVLMCGF